MDLVQASVGFYHRYLERRGVSSEQLQDLLTPYLLGAETSYPESMNVLKGMSIGAMVPILELFAINTFEELEPLLESPEGELLFLQRKEGYVQPPASTAGSGAAGALLERLRPAPRDDVDRAQRALARGGSGQRRGRDRPSRRRTRPGGISHGRLLPPGGRAERPRSGPGHRIAHRLGRRRGRPEGAGVPELARGSLPSGRRRQSRDARAGGRLRARLRVPGRRVHGGDHRAATPRARSATGRTRTTTWTPGSPRSHHPPPRAAGHGSPAWRPCSRSDIPHRPRTSWM